MKRGAKCVLIKKSIVASKNVFFIESCFRDRENFCARFDKRYRNSICLRYDRGSIGKYLTRKGWELNVDEKCMIAVFTLQILRKGWTQGETR